MGNFQTADGQALNPEKKWKDKFLSSGLPLELEVANILFQKDFFIDGEFPYSRHEGHDSKNDFSIDLLAHRYLPGETSGEAITADISFLIECKYRNPSKRWLFFRDCNSIIFSPANGNLIRDFSEFTTFDYCPSKLSEFHEGMDRALKACEFSDKGDSNDTDIRHGVNQLRYALPDVICNHLELQATCHPGECKPFFIVPILVTNAPLGIIRNEITIDSLTHISNFESLYDPAVLIDLFSPYARNFETHASRVFSDFSEKYQILPNRRNNFELKLKKISGRLKSTADVCLKIQGLAYYREIYSKFLVVNLLNLSNAIDRITKAVLESVKNKKQVVGNDLG